MFIMTMHGYRCRRRLGQSASDGLCMSCSRLKRLWCPQRSNDGLMIINSIQHAVHFGGVMPASSHLASAYPEARALHVHDDDGHSVQHVSLQQRGDKVQDALLARQLARPCTVRKGAVSRLSMHFSAHSRMYAFEGH